MPPRWGFLLDDGQGAGDEVWPLDAMSAAVIAANLTGKTFYRNPAAERPN
jgi:hypothetical protein